MPPIALRLAKLRLVKLRFLFLLSGNSTMVLMALPLTCEADFVGVDFDKYVDGYCDFPDC